MGQAINRVPDGQSDIGERRMDDLSLYASKISFRFIEPSTASRTIGLIQRRAAGFLRRRGVAMDVLNTRIPEDEAGTKDGLRELSKIQRMSTIAIGALINKIVREMPDSQCFVNVGVWHGFSFLCGIINNVTKKCIGIDNFSQFKGPREAFLERFTRLKGPKHYFYDENYLDYFQNIHEGPIGFYIYDGEHSYKNQLHGLKAAEPFLALNSLILVDDTDWEEPRQATLDFISNSSSGYRIVLDKKTAQNGHPTWWNGIMLLQKIS